MLSQPGSLIAIMLAFLFGFASIKAEEIPDGIMPKKRVVGTGGTTSTTPTTSNAPTTSNTPTTSNAPTTSKTPTTSNAPVSSGTTTIPITSSNADGTTTTAHVKTTSLTSDSGSGTGTGTGTSTSTDSAVTTKGATVKVGSKTINAATLSEKTTVRAALVTKATRHYITTSVYTSKGQVYSSVYSTQNVYESTTGYATATIAPSLAHAGGNGSNLSTNTKKIVGGVVGGIGGAIVIAGLAFVAWRLWGRKKNQDEPPRDHLQYSTDSLSNAKRYSQNTLMTEPYNNPNGPVNTASNF